MKNAYDNTNTGVLFANKYKETDKQPNMRGNYTPGPCQHCGKPQEELQLAGWTRTGKNDDKYIFVKSSEKRNPNADHTRESAVSDTNIAIEEQRKINKAKVAERDRLKYDADMPF
tara:strand:+ start:2194 stop:2538 length:345 start_codon:yes stop_codon:yes gene_type:complete